MTRRHMECVPQWLVDKAVKIDLDETWDESYVAVKNEDVFRVEDCITAHFF